MRRTTIGAFTLILIVLASAALAQTTAEFDVGSREVGSVHPLTLTARNDNCPQNLNFRFEFAPSPWLRASGSNRVRGIPTGESRPLAALIDLTQMQPGRYTAQVDVVCENCEFLIIRNCGFDRQHLVITVDATAPAAVAEPTAPATPQPSPRANPPATPPPAPELQPLAAETPTLASGMTTPPTVEAPPPCDCAGRVGLMQMLAVVAGGVALVGLMPAAWGFSAAGAARAAAETARNLRRSDSAPQDDARQFFQEKTEELEEIAQNARKELVDLMQAQLQAMRALSALGLVDRALVAPETSAWLSAARGAGYTVDEAANAIISGRGEGTLLRVIEGAHARDDFTLFSATPAAARAEHSQRLAWLRLHGFADSDAGAQRVLNEAASYAAGGHSMADMNERLQALADEVRRCDAERAMFIAKLGGS